MTVNWTPFLTLFPRRFPAAKDIFGFLLCLWLNEEGESASSAFRCPGRLRSRLKRTDEFGKRLSNSVVTHPRFPHFSHNRVLRDYLS